MAALQAEFERQTRGLPAEVVRRCHPWNFTAPCQVVDLWCALDDRHDVTVIHHPGVDPGRIDVVGPLQPADVVPAMERILADPIWAAPATVGVDDWPRLPQKEPGKVVTLRDLQTIHYGYLLKQISGLLFHRYRVTGMGSVGGHRPDLIQFEWFGTWRNIDVQAEIARTVSQARHDHAEYIKFQEAKQSTPEAAPPQREPASDGHWTCLYPSVAIGPQPDITVWAAFTTSARGLFQVPRSDVHAVSGTPFHYTREGYVLVQGASAKKARQALNHLAYLMTHRGIPIQPVSPKHVASFVFDKTGRQQHGSFTTLHQIPDPFRNQPTSLLNFDFIFSDFGTTRFMTQDGFEAFAVAAWHMTTSPWATEVEWLMDARAHDEDARHAPALLTAWQAVERLVFRHVDDFLATTGTPGEVRNRIQRDRYADVIRLANKLGVLNVPTAADLAEVNDARNGVLHRGAEATDEQAKVAINWLQRMLDPLLSRHLANFARMDDSPGGQSL